MENVIASMGWTAENGTRIAKSLTVDPDGCSFMRMPGPQDDITIFGSLEDPAISSQSIQCKWQETVVLDFVGGIKEVEINLKNKSCSAHHPY